MPYEYEIFERGNWSEPRLQFETAQPLPHIVKGHFLFLGTSVSGTQLGHRHEILDVTVLVLGGSGTLPIRSKVIVHIGPEEQIR